MKILRLRFILLALAAAALGGAAIWLATPRESMPSVTYTLLDGSRADTSQLKGKVVLVNFWATSCATCVKEMPHIVSTYQKYQSRGFETLAVAMSYDPPSYVSSFVSSRQLPFPVALDTSGEMAAKFGQVKLTPTIFIVDRSGRVVKRYVGVPDFPTLHALLEELLAEGA